MRRTHIFSLFIVFLALFAFACSEGSKTGQSKPKKQRVSKLTQKEKPQEITVKLTQEQIQGLIKIARKAFDAWVKERKVYEPTKEELSNGLDTLRGNRVFASIYKRGVWRGCVSAQSDLLYKSVVQAVINTCQDRRFKNPTPDEISEFRIELNILQPKEEIPTKDLNEISKHFIPGVHGLYLTNGKRSAFFLPYVFVKRTRTLKQWLERLSKKATGGVDKDFWRKPNTKIYKFYVIDFIEEKPYGKAVMLYRYRVMLPSVSAKDVDNATKVAWHWLNSQFDSNTGLLFPGYFGKTSALLRTENLCEQAIALRFATLSEKFLNSKFEHAKRIEKTLLSRRDKKLGNLIPHIDVASKESIPDVCANLHLAAYILEKKGKPTKQENEFIKAVKNWLAKKVIAKGAVDLRGTYLDVEAVEHAGGLVLEVLSLMALKNKDKQAEELAHKLWRYLFVSFRPNRAEVAYQLFRGAVAYYNLTNDTNIPDMLLMLAQSALNRQYRLPEAKPVDLVGGIKRINTASTQRTAEAILEWADVLTMAKSVDKLKKDETFVTMKQNFELAITLAARFLLEHQLTEINGFFFPNLPVVKGAFWNEGTPFAVKPGVNAVCIYALLSALDTLSKRFDEVVKQNSGEFKRPL